MAIDTLGANALASNSVTTAKIASDAVTTAKIVNDAVTSAKIPAGAVVASDVADGSVTTAKLANNAVTGAKLFADNFGRRNILINGAFQIWQRGTSFTSNVYGSDRWKLYAPGSHAYSRSTDTPDFFEYSASVGGSGDATGLTQFVESVNAKHIPSSGTTKVILSFYLKHTTNSGTDKITSVVGTMDSADNSGASTNRSTQNHTTTGSWARYTHEMTGADLTAAVTNGLTVNIKHNGSGATAFLLTGCQLEINDEATPFEHRSFGEEIALCQRYYCHSYNYGTYPGANTGGSTPLGKLANGHGYDSLAQFQFPAEMRSVPTMTLYNPITGTVNSFRGDSSNYSGAAIHAATTRGVRIYRNATVGATVFTFIHATANAEL